MWIAKIRVPYDPTALLGNLCKKYHVELTGYPVANSIEKDCVRITAAGFIKGEEKDINSFFKSLKKDKRFINLERNGNFFISEAKQDISNRYLFQPGIIHLKPSIANNKGEYIFELASWDKLKLMKIIEAYQVMNAELISIKQEKIKDIQISKLSPSLTEKQRDCLQLAIDNGYYGYPRKIDLQELSKKMKLSYSTYQFHLRNAEKKVMPYLSLGL